MERPTIDDARAMPSGPTDSMATPSMATEWTALCAAEVLDGIEKQWCRVQREGTPSIWARIALRAPHGLRPGDRVLLALGADGEAFVIGVLESAPAPEEATAAVFHEGAGGEERLGVRDAGGRVLFEYRPESGQATLRAPRGDLVLESATGAVRVVAAADIGLAAGGSLRAATGDRIELQAGRAEAEPASLELSGRHASLRGRALSLRARRADLEVEEGRVRARALCAEAGRLDVVAEVVETSARRILERAESVRRRVSGLHETIAGRMRLLTSGAFLLRSRRMNVRGDEGVRIDGETIHLG